MDGMYTVHLKGVKMTTFNPDKKFSDKFIPLFDKHIQLYLSTNRDVVNMAWDNKINRIMDKHYHIDAIATDSIGSQYSIQTKVRRHKHLHYNDFTMEFYQDFEQKTKGEYFNILAQLYFHGYANKQEDDFDLLYVIDIAPFKKWIGEKYQWINDPSKRVSEMAYNMTKNNDTEHSKASFLYINYNDIIKERFCQRIELKPKLES